MSIDESCLGYKPDLTSIKHPIRGCDCADCILARAVINSMSEFDMAELVEKGYVGGLSTQAVHRIRKDLNEEGQ